MDLTEIETQLERSLKSFDFDYRTPSGQTLSQTGINITYRNDSTKRIGETHAEVKIVFRTYKSKVTTADKAFNTLKSTLNKDVVNVGERLIATFDGNKLLNDQPMVFREFDTSRSLDSTTYWTYELVFSLPVKV